MSERDFWDEESFQEYKADLIRQRNELNPITNQFHIKILDGMIEKLPERYSDFFDDEENTPQKQKNAPIKGKLENNKTPFLQKILDNIGLYLLLSPFIIGGLFPIVMMFIAMWKVCNGNIGMLIINVLSIPFVLLGIINIFRGFCLVVMEIDSEKFKKYWQFVMYFIANIIGYIAIVLVIVQWLKFQ